MVVTAGIDVIYAAAARWALPLKFIVPGVLLLLAFQLIPIIYTINVAFTNYSTGHVLSRGGGDGDPAQLAGARRERQDVHHDAGARRRRQARAAARRRRRAPPTSAPPTASRSSTRTQGHGQGRQDHGRRGLRGRAAEPAVRPQPAAHHLPRARGQDGRDPAAGLRHRRAAGADAALRRGERHVHEDLRRHGLPRQRQGLVRGGQRRRARAGLEGVHRLPPVRPRADRPAGARPVPAGAGVDVRLRVPDRAAVVLARPAAGDGAGQAGDAVPQDLPLAADHPLRGARLPLAAGVGRHAQRRLRGHQPQLRAGRPVAVRRELGQGLGDHGQRLADRALLLPGQPGRAAVDPQGADRGGAHRRRHRRADLPPRAAAAAAGGGRAAADRVVRVQLQQLQQRLPADRGRAVLERPADGRRHRHPHQLHVQDRLRHRQGSDYALASAVAIFIFGIVATVSAFSFWRTKSLENLR